MAIVIWIYVLFRKDYVVLGACTDFKIFTYHLQRIQFFKRLCNISPYATAIFAMLTQGVGQGAVFSHVQILPKLEL